MSDRETQRINLEDMICRMLEDGWTADQVREECEYIIDINTEG